MKIANLDFKGQLIIYADDLTLLYRNKHIDNLGTAMNSDMKLIQRFVSSLRLVVNAKKTAYAYGIRGKKSERTFNCEI